MAPARRATSTVERLRRLMEMLDDSTMTSEALIAAFLRPPIYSNAFARGLGTLYSAAYWPGEGRADFFWPGVSWSQSFADFTVGDRLIEFGASPPPPNNDTRGMDLREETSNEGR
ncbi:hypothetical protein [Candidatus Accumulibacter sp. ACC005]|uniref:hypothetical protein n=1 Tax=Candidatus Accumulibacter sp. ACC005 TaxID=2823331 RepID=UPI0025C1CC95|nr:hypothetical protein [Candidatus Accumulibacter sp. ACC005]